MSSVPAGENSQYKSRRSSNKGDISENFIEELPINDDNMRFEIMKEFRRLYGNKLDRIFLKNNVQNSSNTLEIILRNIRLARQQMMKVGIGHADPDDLIVNINLLTIFTLDEGIYA